MVHEQNGKFTALETAIHNYILGNHEVVKHLIESDDGIRTGILEWLKKMEDSIGKDIYGVEPYLVPLVTSIIVKYVIEFESEGKSNIWTDVFHVSVDLQEILLELRAKHCHPRCGFPKIYLISVKGVSA